MLHRKLLYAGKVLFIALFLSGIIADATVYAQTAPAPYGLTPSTRQVEWFSRERQAFVHFSLGTYYTQDWAPGNMNVNLFTPGKLNCNQWCRILKMAGFKSAILTAKHCDGFCLWPSAYTTHSVKYDTAWMGGKGDVVKMFTDACHAWGLKVGFYVSPWDANQVIVNNNDTYNTSPAYATYMANQLSELLRNYGQVDEIWWDGSTVGSHIAAATWDRWADTIRAIQPQCVIWGDCNAATTASPSAIDLHYIGSEIVSGMTSMCWLTINRALIVGCGNNGDFDSLTFGELKGDSYLPSETNQSILSNDVWFWHGNTTNQVRTVTDLWSYYFTALGRNTTMLLNNPPDSTGLIIPNDSAAAVGMYSWILGTFKSNLLAGSAATALHTRGSAYGPSNMIDTAESTYFATPDSIKTDTVVFVPPAAITFNCAMLQEVIQLGERTTKWAIDAYYNNAWNTVVADSGIGYKRLRTFTQVTSATQVRLRILSGLACPAIHTFGVYEEAQATVPQPDSAPLPTSVAPRINPPSDLSQNILRIAGNRLVLPAGLDGSVKVSIIDIQGRCVRLMIAEGTGLEQRLVLPALKPGLYLVKCTNGRLALEQKFINQR